MPAHISCLLQWIQTKCSKNKKKKRITIYNLKDLKCDICLETYPEKILINNKLENLLKIEPETEDPFLIFDVYNIKGVKITKKIVIKLDWDEDLIFSVGRNDKNDLVFKDISVSREHGIFYWKDNLLYVFDRESKFGTYFLVDKKIELEKCVGKEFVIDKFCVVFHAFNRKRCQCLREGKWVRDQICTDRDFEVSEEERVRCKSDQVVKKKFGQVFGEEGNEDFIQGNKMGKYEVFGENEFGKNEGRNKLENNGKNEIRKDIIENNIRDINENEEFKEIIQNHSEEISIISKNLNDEKILISSINDNLSFKKNNEDEKKIDIYINSEVINELKENQDKYEENLEIKNCDKKIDEKIKEVDLIKIEMRIKKDNFLKRKNISKKKIDIQKNNFFTMKNQFENTKENPKKYLSLKKNKIESLNDLEYDLNLEKNFIFDKSINNKNKFQKDKNLKNKKIIHKEKIEENKINFKPNGSINSFIKDKDQIQSSSQLYEFN